jgi:hypothetical protein
MCTNPELVWMEVWGMNPARLSSEMGYGFLNYTIAFALQLK